MTTTALIIFVRHPVLGKVKTRLAKGVGDEKALEIYKLLLKHTLQITGALPFPKFVYYSDGIQEHDLWSHPEYTKRRQTGNDLGERMSNAFQAVFEQGFTKAIIIGSDCYQLTAEIIQEAVNALQEHPIALGPAFDGGYYLLGMNRFIPELFVNKTWSTDQVAGQTLGDAERLKLPYALLPRLHDVDEAADLEVVGIAI